MSGFIEAVLSFPTVLFTPLLLVVIGYWVVVIAGGADPESGADAAEHGPLHFLGLGGVPAPVTLSLLIAVAWITCLTGAQIHEAQFHGPVPLWVVPIAALVPAWLVTRLATIPLKRLMPTGPDLSRSDFIGLTCVIRTGRVTRTFGQAEVRAPDGSSAIVQVRQAGDDDLRAGTEALLFDMEPDGGFFWVVPLDIATKGH